MKSALRSVLLILFSVSSFAGSLQGIQPRRQASDFPVRQTLSGTTIGAALLSSDQVRSAFVSDLNRGFLVVEIAFYPEEKLLELRRDAFVLKTERNEVIARATSPEVIAANLQKAAASDRDVALYPTVGVGYESGPSVYDPISGTRRGGGWHTDAGMGVGIGKSQSGATEQDRRAMELELSEKGLPEGSFTKPVSGYLYFPLKDKKKSAGYLLEFDCMGEPVILRLTSASVKR